ncbi:MAG: Ribosomal large subunit pseudouridine synthase B [Legionellaceae bacterium]
MSEKLQKLLAQAGLGSRRQLEEWIASGRVIVNGKVAQVGDRALATDKILVDGRIVKFKKEGDFKQRVIIYHKPEGIVCTRSDPEGRQTVFEHLPRLSQQRWIMVGRLDLNTSGLLLFTNEGEIANRLMHPSYEIEREYAVRILGEVTPLILQRLKKGVELDDGIAKFETIKDAGGVGVNHWYHVVLKEGRNREVRRIWESQGLKVSRLIRIRYGTISLPRMLRPGRWIDLPQEELTSMLALIKMPMFHNKNVFHSRDKGKRKPFNKRRNKEYR